MARQVFKNIGFLGISQAANYLLPLVTIPYITRVVGPENYGLIELATTVMLYFTVVVIYGFSYTATRRIAAFPDRSSRIVSVFSTVMYTRFLLFLLLTALFVVLMFSVPKFAVYPHLFLYAFPIVLGWALYPDFLFQGLQKLSVIAFANLAIKVLAAALIFILLREEEDFYLVVGINAFAQIMVAIATLLYALKVLPPFKWPKPNVRLIKAYLKSGWYMFLSHFFTRIYTFGTILFMGFLLTDTALGLFAAAMKLIIVGQSFLFMPLGGALFPYFANLYKNNLEDYQKAHRRFMRLMLLVSAVASTIVMLIPEFFVQLVFGPEYLAVTPYFRWMIPILFVTTFSHFSLYEGLMVLRKDQWHLRIILMVGLLSLVLNYTLINAFELWGAAWAKILIELSLAGLGWYYFKKAMGAEKAKVSQKAV